MDIYQLLATLILTTFYAAYIAKGVLLKRQGVVSNRLAKGDKPKTIIRIEVALLAVTYGMVVVQIVSIYLLPLLFGMPLLRIFGLTIAFAGVISFIAAIVVMKDSWRAGIDIITPPTKTHNFNFENSPFRCVTRQLHYSSIKTFPKFLERAKENSVYQSALQKDFKCELVLKPPRFRLSRALRNSKFSALNLASFNWRSNTQQTKLVQTGIYRYSRNPAFVGFDLLYLGTALCFPNVYVIVLSLCGVILFHMQILSEENYLRKTFGNEYIEYTAKVRRYLGRQKVRVCNGGYNGFK